MNDPTPTPVAQDSAILAVVVVVVVASVALAVVAVAVYRKKHHQLQIGRTPHTVPQLHYLALVGHFIVLYVEWWISIPIKEQCVFVCLFVFFSSATRHLSTLRRCLRVLREQPSRRGRPRAAGKHAQREHARMPYNFSTK